MGCFLYKEAKADIQDNVPIDPKALPYDSHYIGNDKFETYKSPNFNVQIEDD